MSRSSESASGAGAPDLDSPEVYERFDPGGMRARIAGFPEQSRDAWRLGREWPIPDALSSPPSRVVIIAVGGSAMGGDVAATLALSRTAIPVQLIRDYTLPPLDERTLVVACSFSGETEEVLTAFRAALALPGPRLAITTGGSLAAMAAQANIPLFTYDFDGQPRSALGYGILVLLAILDRVGALPIDAASVGTMQRGLSDDAARLTIHVPEPANEAKQLASWIHGSVPIVVGTDFLAVAARRWADQISENAKQWAFARALPELDHNLIMGFGAPSSANGYLRALILDALPAHPRNRARVDLTAHELTDVNVETRVVQISGETPLETVMRAAQFGDWVSLYLAILNGVDPSTIEPITRLKAALMRTQP